MEETLIWVGGLLIEALLIATAALIVMLRRSHKERQQLLAQLAGKETHSAEAAVIPAEAPEETLEAPAAKIEPAAIAPVETEAPAVEIPVLLDAQPDAEDDPAKAVDTSITSEFEQLREIIDNAQLSESTERLQQRLDATHQSLERLAVDLDQESDTGERRLNIEPLRHNLKEMTTEVDSLQQNNAQLQHDLRHKAQDMEKTIAEKQENTDRVLHHAKKLRRDMSMLRDKLKNRESDVQQLQTANEALGAEYSALMKEYERIYNKVPAK
ncbi:MAG: hypothetical protein ABW171_10740 [Steroidobacter sp.]